MYNYAKMVWPHDWPYCAEKQPAKPITDTERIDFIASRKARWYAGCYHDPARGTLCHPDHTRGTLCYDSDRKAVEGVTMRDAIDAVIRAEAAA